MRACFPPTARVRHGRDFRAAFGDGLRCKTRFFSLHLRPRDGGFCRLGMAVSRKVSPLAVQRNRIKRQCREWFRLRRADLPSADYIITARHEAARQDNPTLRADLDRLLERGLALLAAAPPVTMPPGAAKPATDSPPLPDSPTSPA
jgi:ribonuclease P protein component